MRLYDILAEGYHTPLTADEIAQLFRSGQLQRGAPCKVTDARQWRTVDELFPLLKYGGGESVEHSNDAGWAGASRERLFVAAGVVVLLTAALGVAGFLLLCQGEPPSMPSAGTVRQIHTPSTAAGIAAAAPRPNFVPDSYHPSPQGEVHRSAPRSTPAADQGGQARESQREGERRLAAERQRREQDQRERDATAERLRAEESRKVETKKLLAGTDIILPLNETRTINVGGVSVGVRVVDNDVTSFDIWINGTRYRNMRKNKGINGSRADETQVYSNSNAQLYYVWELSGKLNHCRMRVREQ